jgi:hypothetical protein
MPLINGEWSTTAAMSFSRAAKSTVGTVPIDWPYNTICCGRTLYRDCRFSYAHCTSAYKFASVALPELHP